MTSSVRGDTRLLGDKAGSILDEADAGELKANLELTISAGAINRGSDGGDIHQAATGAWFCHRWNPILSLTDPAGSSRCPGIHRDKVARMWRENPEARNSGILCVS